jgi:hypothetical protein
MQEYRIYKDGKLIDHATIRLGVDLTYMKKRLRTLQGNTLHVVHGDVTDVYRMINNRVYFNHKFTK